MIHAFLICEKVITEVGTKKKTLVGVFDIITAPRFPCMHNELWVYVNIGDILAEQKIKLELIYMDENKIIGEGTGILQKTEKLNWELAYCFYLLFSIAF